MRIPFLRPKSEATAAAPKKRGRAAPPPLLDDPAGVQAARTQARRRLVGAVVLLLIGIVGFPILFETQPRPLPMDTPIEAPHRDSVAGGPVVKEISPTPVRSLPAAVLPPDPSIEEAASSPAPAPVASVPEQAKVDVKPKAETKIVEAKPEPKAEAKPASAPAVAKAASVPSKAATTAAATTTTSTPASPASTAAASAPAASERYVVQAGAYKDTAKLREARSKIEGLGYKTYTQIVETDTGTRTRVRIGPYGTRAEADAVAAKVKRSGLSVVIVAL